MNITSYPIFFHVILLSSMTHYKCLKQSYFIFLNNLYCYSCTSCKVQSTECTDGEAMTECFRLIVSFLFAKKVLLNKKICTLRHLLFNHSYIWLIWLTFHFVNIPEHFIEVNIRIVNHANFEKPKNHL
jgi:hypothetical protein